MSSVVSLQLEDEQIERLKRAAQQLGRSPSEAATLLLEEALREREFAFIEFRDSPSGPQAYLAGSRLAVWQITSLLRAFDGDQPRLAAHLEIPQVQVAAAVAYATAYPDEIETAISDNTEAAAHLDQLIPNLEHVVIDATAP